MPANQGPSASPITLYDASIAQLVDVVSSLEGILQEAAKSPDAGSLPEARLAPDMRPLSFQVWAVGYACQAAVSRLTGTEEGADADWPRTIPDMLAMAEQALALLRAVDPARVNGTEGEPVQVGPLKWGSIWHMTRKSFVLGHAIPNAFFHLQTAYCILRMRGVPLGKMTYLCAFAGEPDVPAQG